LAPPACSTILVLSTGLARSPRLVLSEAMARPPEMALSVDAAKHKRTSATIGPGMTSRTGKPTPKGALSPYRRYRLAYELKARLREIRLHRAAMQRMHDDIAVKLTGIDRGLVALEAALEVLSEVA
jgi:hypothetical protein